MAAHAFNTSTLGHKQADLCEFEASLKYSASSRTDNTATQRNSVFFFKVNFIKL